MGQKAPLIRFSPNPNRAHLIRWFEWGKEAFDEAESRDRPVMLFVGAFWCGLCQRMDEVAFSNDENIALLNGCFVPIRVENAQRPDVDVRYSENGWPTIAFLTPQGDPLASVNYLPGEEFGNTLARIHLFYRDRKEEVREAVRQAYRDLSQKKPQTETGRAINNAALAEISQLVIGLADRENGGYGRGHKFPHPEANEFLLDRYETTGDDHYLNHVLLTLDKMREGRIRDGSEGGFFRYSSKPDWSEPHLEKLLADQAGLLGNCLRAFSLTRTSIYQDMAAEIIAYLDTRLSGPDRVTFYGCQDYARTNAGKSFPVIDDCVYTDANAQAASAYLEASSVLGRPDYRERALRVLGFLWERCRENGAMVHYFDGLPRIPGLLMDQVCVGLALLKANEVTADGAYLSRAIELAEYVLERFRNTNGGYYDLCVLGPGRLSFRLTLVEQNGAVAKFFLKLAEATKEEKYHDAALGALSVFTEDLTPYGIHCAGLGRALAERERARDRGS
jgi:uncharacterized protein YyaL (SSP411 family)